MKPRLRGVFHEVGFYAALGLGAALVVTADGERARTAAAVFAGSVAFCFGASALYHRPTWRPPVRAWLARLDHAGVFLLIAGTYTPFGLLVMSEGWAVPVMTIAAESHFGARNQKSFNSVALGWVSAAAFSQLL